MNTTPDTFRAAAPDIRVQLVEDLIVSRVRALRPGEPAWFDANTKLADLAIDSIQLVELKFAVEQLVGAEVDVALLIVNPTVRELAEQCAGLGGH
ncbi:MAG: acyl carrier protein [Vicinamibacterales bacterium]